MIFPFRSITSIFHAMPIEIDFPSKNQVHPPPTKEIHLSKNQFEKVREEINEERINEHQYDHKVQ